jgi:DNA polymerase-3 subunit beta
MEFKITQKNLQKAMSVVGGCIEKKATIAVLQNVKIESVGESNIRITATDLDTTMRIDVGADIKTAGILCINGEKLSAIVPTLPDGEISFTKESNNWASVTAGKTKLRIAGTDVSQFPEMTANKSTPISIRSADLKSMIERTIFSTSQELSQFALNAVKLEIGGGVAKMVSTDSTRLSLASSSVDKKASLDLMIPRKAAMEIMKIEAETVNIGEDANHLFVEGDGFMLTARKLTGRFPNYEMILPKDNTLSVSFDVDELRRVVRRCHMFASFETLRCDLSDGTAAFSAQSAEQGEITDAVDAVYSGEPISIGFNSRFLMEFLNVASDGQMQILFSEKNNVPAIFTAESLPDYQYILVPLNLSVAAAVESSPAKTKARKK